MANEPWSIPPITTDSAPGRLNENIILARGVVYEIHASAPYLLQNVSENEDDYIEFSQHGDKDGIWGKLNTHSLLKFNQQIYILNRSHKENVVATIFRSKL